MSNNEELSEKDKELERYFQSELENLNHFTLYHMETREKLPKVTMPDEIQERANETSVGIYQLLIPYQRLKTFYMQCEKLLDTQLE